MDRPIKKKTSDIFFSTFLGEYVEIICKHEAVAEGKLVVQGYILDMDEDYYFLGENPIEINACLKKEDASFISIMSKIDPNVELLENMPVPEDELENN